MKTSRDQLIVARILEHVSRQLLDRKLIERLVVVERADGHATQVQRPSL